MRRSTKPIIIASRQSSLARIQAESVGRALAKLNPQIEVQYRWITSEGDRFFDATLAEIGGKGLFTRAVDEAVLKGEADIAVHSMKDLPVTLPPGLSLAAVPKRGDVRDCLVGPGGFSRIQDLPQNAAVGTSSPRRKGQLLHLRPDVRVQPIRGNVDTRIDKAMRSEDGLTATVLAAAGLRRLKKTEHAKNPLALEDMLPAAAQAAIALHCRADDHVSLTRCLPLNHAATATAVNAERLVLEGLEATCESPVAVLAEPVQPEQAPRRNADAHWFRLRVRVLEQAGGQMLRFDERAKSPELRRMVKDAVQKLKDQGAMKLMHPMRGGQA